MSAFRFEDTLRRLSAEVQRFSSLIEGAGLDTPVPGLLDPKDPTQLVSLRWLVTHTGTLHRWVARIAGERVQERVSPRTLDLDLPAGDAEFSAWLLTSGQLAVNALQAAGPDTRVWVWGADPHARWWARRMLHETAVHRADAERALAREPALDPDQAVDGVDEFLENLPSSGARGLKELPAGGSLHLHSTDTEGEWLIQLAPGGFTWQHGHAKGDVAVRARAEDLLLLVWGRCKPPSPERFQIFGDQALLARWLAASSF